MNVKGIKITPDGIITLVTVAGLEDMKRIVGGYIELVRVAGLTMYANEEGLIHRQPFNKLAARLAGQVIVGTVLVLGPMNEDGESADLSTEEIIRIKAERRKLG
jgi:uracil phosphoribosyltransferase